MRRQVVKIVHYGTWRVIEDDAKKVNQFIVTKNGHKVIDYADLTSCLCYLTNEVERNADEVIRLIGGAK